MAASLPIVIGYFPIALSFGVAASQVGLGVGQALLLSLVVYAGASQFVALALIAGGSPLLLGIVTLLAMNARHVFYGPALLARLGERSAPRYAFAWAFGLTDEVFAATLARVSRSADDRSPSWWSEGWMTGIGLGAYLAWVGGTAVGGVLGSEAFTAYPVVAAALGFMLPALFVALLLSLVSRRLVPLALVAVAACLVATWVSTATTGILVGMLTGALFGVWGRTAAGVEAEA